MTAFLPTEVSFLKTLYLIPYSTNYSCDFAAGVASSLEGFRGLFSALAQKDLQLGLPDKIQINARQNKCVLYF